MRGCQNNGYAEKYRNKALKSAEAFAPALGLYTRKFVLKLTLLCETHKNL